MKIYWKNLIWNYTIRYWWNLTHLITMLCYENIQYAKKLIDAKDAKHKGDMLFWDNYWDRRFKKAWNSKQKAECEKAMASFLPKLDAMLRKVTANIAVTTLVSTKEDQKIYKDGKVVALRKSFS